MRLVLDEPTDALTVSAAEERDDAQPFFDWNYVAAGGEVVETEGMKSRPKLAGTIGLPSARATLGERACTAVPCVTGMP